MSRYTAEDLNGLNKHALLQLVLRQPNVPIPRKLTTQPPTSLTKEKLRKLLTGPFGFVKEEICRAHVSMQGQTGEVEEANTSASGQTWQIQGEGVAMGEETFVEAAGPFKPGGQSDQFQGDAMPEDVVENPKQLVKTLGLALDMIQKSDQPSTDDLFIHSKTDFEHSPGNHDNAAYHYTPSTNEVPATSATVITKQELDSLIPMHDINECERKETGELPPPLQAKVNNLPPDVSTAVRVYFISQPEEVEAWQSIDLARKKKKPDFAVIRYTRQVLTLHDKLKNYTWPTDTGTLRSMDLANILGFSPAWFTNARHILDEYNKVGPESGQTNDAIVARFQEKVAFKKGCDLLQFLRTQRKLIEGETVDKVALSTTY